MLDDLKYIHQRDGQDALGIAEKQWQQYIHSFGFEGSSDKPIKHLVIAGMGGSALAARILPIWPGLSVPITLVQSYDLPKSADADSLLICVSYSGNTEETISVLEEALKQPEKPAIVVVASGGKLAELAKDNNLPLVVLPDGYQPRVTLGFQLRALLEITQGYSLIQNSLGTLEKAAAYVKDAVVQWRPDNATKDNPAKKLAEELAGKSVVVYGGPLMAPIAYKWKINFNENAKNVAWWNQYSEFNHNEMIGWVSQPIEKPYGIVDLRSNLEHPRIQKRFEVTEKLLSGRRPAPNVVQVEGETILEQLLWAVAYGDFVSVYLALLNNVNPAPVDLVEKFKLELDK